MRVLFVLPADAISVARIFDPSNGEKDEAGHYRS